MVQPNVARLIEAIGASLQQNLRVVVQAAKDAHDAATHSESVAQNKYDTFGLENAYLAQGQQKRVDEVKEALYYFQNVQSNRKRNVQPLDLDLHRVSMLDLVVLENADDVRYFFLAPYCGGLSIELDNLSVTVVTPGSPLGRAIKGAMVDDRVSMIIKGQMSKFELVNIF